jgi:hypothetical protein
MDLSRGMGAGLRGAAPSDDVSRERIQLHEAKVAGSDIATRLGWGQISSLQ